MAEASSKKRKRDSDSNAKSKKKVAIDLPKRTVKVSSVTQPKCPPVIATAPGIEMPDDLHFRCYSRQEPSKSKKSQSKQAGNNDLLLHTNEHRSLDYTAKEEAHINSAPALNHFLGVYDPKTGKLEVMQAKKMTVRGAVRAKQASAASLGELDVKQTMMERKTDLGQTFGTKKAKKALQDRVLNTISPQKKAGDDGSPRKLDGASRAMLDSVGSVTSKMATREELQSVVDEAKPAPKANLDAEDIEDVYDPEAIIGTDTLNLVPIREWQEKVKHKENIQIPSRFVAARVNAIASNDDAEIRLRVLRYLSFVLIFYLSTKPGRQRGTRSLPSREKLREILDPAPEAVIENIRRKFSDEGQMRKFHLDMLMTHCCTFACIVDNFEVDTQHLREDLRIDQKEINKYFHEIGGRVKPVSSKGAGKAANIARLVLPLSFPKQRHINVRR